MKDYKESAIVQQYAAARNVGVDDLKESNVGTNGYNLGQIFHTTGLTVIPATNTSAPYIAVTTKEGTNLSLRSLMGVSSLKGYELAGNFESESLVKNTKVSKTVTAGVIDGFYFEWVFQPSTRQFLAFAAECESTDFWANKTVTYLGTVVRPYVAKNDSPATAFEKYKKDYKRAISTRLWSVED